MKRKIREIIKEIRGDKEAMEELKEWLNQTTNKNEIKRK